MKVTSPWFLGFLFWGAALVTAGVGWGLSLTPRFGLLAVSTLFSCGALWGLSLMLDDFICETCDLSLQRYYGFVWGFAGAFLLGLLLAFLLVVL